MTAVEKTGLTRLHGTLVQFHRSPQRFTFGTVAQGGRRGKPWLLGVVALGLLAFGLYSMLTALWFRFNE